MSFFSELKRRNVFRVGIAYAIASWLLLQMSDILVPLLGLPESAQKLILLLLVIGFVPALISAWAFEMTPDGIKKEKDVDRQASVTPKTGFKLNIAIIGMLVIALGYFVRESRFEAEQTDERIEVVENSPGQPATAVIEKSVAVLPFVNMSSDPEQEYFSDGLSEELLNRLAQNDQLRVAARTSAFQFKGQNIDIIEIGKKLNVANVLEGSVRKSGNRLRITAQLIHVDDGFHLWSQTYEREADDVFAIQDDISSAITKALEIELGATAQTGGGQPTQNLEAYNLYLEARYLLAKRGEQNMRKADELFVQATTLDPNFSLAWSGMAFNAALLSSWSFDMLQSESFERTMFAANKAIELDPMNAEAYTAIGRTLDFSSDWDNARESFEHAYRLEPNYVGVLNLYGDFLTVMGDLDKAIDLKQRAINLDPLAPVHAFDIAWILVQTGRPDEAVNSARRAVYLAPENFKYRGRLIFVLLKTGAFDEARTLIEQSAATQSTAPMQRRYIIQWWALYYFHMDDAEQLRNLLQDNIRAIESGENTGTLGLDEIAFYTFWLDGPGPAIPWLEREVRSRGHLPIDTDFFYLPERMSDDPAWLEFWNQPELQELFDSRKSHPYQNVGLWKGPREQ